ncbi:MAG: DUF1254 domain-containing protein [Synergistaceae bacterium]|nr:DUF1214 domain-containing protein [Synergistota bacterium]NLM71802.1 DUF1254 domain-containing protein [Synergistaceae bacterium]
MEIRKNLQWYCLVLAIFMLPLAGCSLSGGASSYEEARAIAEEAYIFAYPMLENYRMMQMQAITADNFNRLVHSTELNGPGVADGIREQRDTLSSTAWLDLQAEPMVLTVPPVPDRYYSFQFIDMFAFNFAYVSPRAFGRSGGVFVIAGPDWNGKKPRGVDSVFRSEGNFVLCMGRTEVNGEDDIPNVRAIQERYTLKPLSSWLGMAPPKAPSRDPFPLYMRIAADSAHFISYLNFMLGQTVQHPSEEQLYERFGMLGIGPSYRFDANEFSGTIRDAIDDAVESALEQIEDSQAVLCEETNGWALYRRVFGDRERMQGLYLVRASAAKSMLYGADQEETTYINAFYDEDGDPLDASEQNYVLRFERDELPPVDSFWSLTMYESPSLSLVENDLERYSLGSRTSSLIYGADGSLNIYISAESPGGSNEANWLPAPAGPFSPTLRLYLPQAIPGTQHYVPPAIRKE